VPGYDAGMLDKPIKAQDPGAAAIPPRGKPKSARRRSREYAVQGLYQWLVAGEDSGAIEAHIAETPGFERADREHFQILLHGVIRDIERLHAAIMPFIDRRLEELSPVEHATLLVGSFELLKHPEIPYRVIINEAVELAKTFGGTDGFKYVNGVLDRVAAKWRPLEADAARVR
jgi:transcription antitermination protein NusB